MTGFIENEKRCANDNSDFIIIPVGLPEQLNQMQFFVYRLVEHFNNLSKQLLLMVNGEDGTGKSFTIFALCALLNSHLKRCSPTAKAALLLKGETIQYRM